MKLGDGAGNLRSYLHGNHRIDGAGGFYYLPDLTLIYPRRVVFDRRLASEFKGGKNAYSEDQKHDDRYFLLRQLHLKFPGELSTKNLITDHTDGRGSALIEPSDYGWLKPKPKSNEQGF